MRKVTFIIGVGLIFLAYIMSQQEAVSERHYAGTKGGNAVAAAAGGAGAGMLRWVFYGGVGVATGGAAFGVALVGHVVVGAVAGALTGAASGSSHHVEVFRHPKYSPLQCLLVLTMGVILCIWSTRRKR